MWKKIGIAVVVIAVIGAVGLFILDRTLFAPSAVTTAVPVAPTIAAPAAAPTQAAAQPTQPPAATEAAAPQPTEAAAPAAGAATVYRIDAAQSEARYEVGETFFQGNRFVTAIGRTQGIAGDVLVDFANPANSQIGTIVIDVSQSDVGRKPPRQLHSQQRAGIVKVSAGHFRADEDRGYSGQCEARRDVDAESHRRPDGERNHQACDVRCDVDGQ